MSEASNTSLERSCTLELLVIKAAGIVTGSQNAVGIARVMELVGFTLDERCNMKYYQKVRRKASKLTVVEIWKSTPQWWAQLKRSPAFPQFLLYLYRLKEQTFPPTWAMRMLTPPPPILLFEEDYCLLEKKQKNLLLSQQRRRSQGRCQISHKKRTLSLEVFNGSSKQDCNENSNQSY
jgi:hypothetical protein